jgi:hypothetical protein
LHETSEHPDVQILEHAKELITELEVLGVHAGLTFEDGEGRDVPVDADWEDTDESDVEMA